MGPDREVRVSERTERPGGVFESVMMLRTRTGFELTYWRWAGLPDHSEIRFAPCVMAVGPGRIL